MADSICFFSQNVKNNLFPERRKMKIEEIQNNIKHKNDDVFIKHLTLPHISKP